MSQRGQALVELMLILPIILVLLLAVAIGGMWLHDQLVLIDDVRELGRYAARGVDYYFGVNGLPKYAKALGYADEDSLRVTYAEIDATGHVSWTVETYGAEYNFPDIDIDRMVDEHKQFVTSFPEQDDTLVVAIVDIAIDWLPEMSFRPITDVFPDKMHSQAVFRVTKARMPKR